MQFRGCSRFGNIGDFWSSGVLLTPEEYQREVFFGFWGMVMIGKLDTFGDILKLEESYSLSEVYLTVG